MNSMRRVGWFGALIIWTIFVWVSRLRNVVNNEELSSIGRVLRVAVVVIFVAFAVWAVVAVRRGQPKVLMVFLGWTVGYWLIRGVGILIDDDYSGGFKAVHTVLMAISVALATLAWSELAARQLLPRR